MKMTDDEYLDACDDMEADTPVPCATEGCEEEVLEYDASRGVYFCPVCGREVDKDDVEDYLHRIVNGEYD